MEKMLKKILKIISLKKYFNVTERVVWLQIPQYSSRKGQSHGGYNESVGKNNL